MPKVKSYTSLRSAFVTALLTATFFIFLFIYFGVNLRNHIYEDSKEIAKEISRKAAIETEQYFTRTLMTARSMGNRVLLISEYGGSREKVREILINALQHNSNFLGTWTLWEPNAFDGMDYLFKGDPFHNEQGTLGIGFFRYNDKIHFEIMSSNDYLGSYYVSTKERRSEIIIEPYRWTYSGHNQSFFGTCISFPLIRNNVFLGAIGIDIDLDELNEKLNKVRPYKTGFLSLISSNGMIVSHIDKDLIVKNFFQLIEDPDSLCYSSLVKGKELTLETVSEFSGQKVFRFFYPFNIGRGNPWSMMVEIPIEDAIHRSDQLIIVASLILIAGLGLILFLIFNIFDRRKYEEAINMAMNEIEKRGRVAMENAQNYREIFNSTNEAIFIHDAKTGKVLDVNNVMLEMYGYDIKEEIVGTTVSSFSSEQDSFGDTKAKEYIIKASTEGPQVFEWKAKRKNGEIFWVEVSLRKTQIGGEGKVLAVVRDITERKLAENALKESEEKYRTLMESMNEMVIMADNNHVVHFVNRKFTEILGYLPEEVIGKVGYKIFHDPEDLIIVENANKDRIDKKVSNYELAFKTKDGRKLDFLVSGAPLFDSKGNTIGSIGSMMDITEWKNAEKALRESENRYREHLEVLVKERTENLEVANEELSAINEELFDQKAKLQETLNQLKNTQKQLIQAEKMASLGILASGIAHEINNPLNFIQGGIIGLEKYIQKTLPEQIVNIEHLVNAIKEGVSRSADIVHNLCSYIQIDDEPINVMLFEACFKDSYNIVTALSGKEGLETLHQNPEISIIISDMKMPGMNGIEFIRLAKKSNSKIVCFILTGFSLTDEISKAIKEGLILECFFKPFNMQQIEKAINNTIK